MRSLVAAACSEVSVDEWAARGLLARRLPHVGLGDGACEALPVGPCCAPRAADGRVHADCGSRAAVPALPCSP